jgi:hypothetical protein
LEEFRVVVDHGLDVIYKIMTKNVDSHTEIDAVQFQKATIFLFDVSIGGQRTQVTAGVEMNVNNILLLY